MRVLTLLTDAFGGYGGIALYNRDLLTALCAHPQCQEVVAIPRFIPNACEPLPKKVTYVTEGINSKLRYLATALRMVKRNSKFDLIVCGHINLLPIACLLRNWLGVPVLLEIYGIDAWKPTASRLTNHLVNRIDAFVSISQVTKKRFLEWSHLPEDKGFLLPNAIHTDGYRPGPGNPRLLDQYGLKDKTVMMTLGRLAAYERKGFDEMLELLPDLKTQIPNIAYLIVGDGTDRQRLEAKAAFLGIADDVVFTGFIPEAEKAGHYRLADIYVMPSSGEGFGFVFLEAMACGVPVIASKVDGGREAVRDGELGILVNPADPDEIKGGVLNALRRHKGIVPEGLGYFSYNNFEKRLHGIIDQVIDKQ